MKNHFTRLTNHNHLEKIHSWKTITSQKMHIGKLLWIIPVLKRFGSRKRWQFKAPKPACKEIISWKAKGSNEGLHFLCKKADRIKFSWTYVWFLSLYVLRGEKRMPIQKLGKENVNEKVKRFVEIWQERQLLDHPRIWTRSRIETHGRSSGVNDGNSKENTC